MNNSNDNSLMENGANVDSSCDDASRDISRASSVDRDEAPPPTTMTTRRGWTEQQTTKTEAAENAVETPPESTTGRKTSKRASSIATNKRMTASIKKLDEEETAAGAQSTNIPPPPQQQQPQDEGRPPMRTAVANAAAINEAQNGRKKKGRPRKNESNSALIQERNERTAAGIAGLEALHETTLKFIENSRGDDTAPDGCVKERLSEFAPRTVIQHVELAHSITSDGEGGHIPVQLQALLDNIKRDYLNMIKMMQNEGFKVKVEADIESEKKKKTELIKREKQLKAQIENLIGDSLGLLRSRLGELGISAKNSPEFIEKAKGIVCSHHELQRKRTSLEQEIKNLEAESEKLAAVKEREMVDKLVRERNGMVNHGQIRESVRREIDAILSPSSSSHSFNHAKLSSDVTLTKCGEITTQIRKRPREQAAKQRDWPEKRSKTGGTTVLDCWPSSTTASDGPVAKIEEKNPEMLAKKIIEQGRSLERRTSAATILSPTKNHHSSSSVEVRKLDSSPPYSRTKLPTATTMPSVSATVAAMSSSSVTLPKVDLNIPPHHHQLVLPPHPDSRSRSSEQTVDEMSFGKSKVSTTPRAEQFEDRLKTIIHSVLSNDEQQQQQQQQQQPPVDMKPQHLPPPPQSPRQQQQPMFSPVKRELPTHLPPPPSSHHHPHPHQPARNIPYPQPPSNYGHGPPPPPHHVPPHPPQQPQHHPHQQPHPYPGRHPSQYPPQKMVMKREPPSTAPSSSRATMNDLISSEIERSMHLSQQQRRPPSAEYSRRLPPPPSSHSLPPRSMAAAVAAAASHDQMTRMSQVIEDSIRGGEPPHSRLHQQTRPPPPPPPPGAGPPPPHHPHHQQQLPPAAHHGHGQPYPPSLPPQTSPSSSRLEGLGCPRSRSPPYDRRPPPRTSNGPSSSSSNQYPAMEGLAARFGPYMDRERNRERPSSSTSPQLPYNRNKRNSPPSMPLPSPPVLPPKKQHLDADHPSDYRMPKGKREPIIACS